MYNPAQKLENLEKFDKFFQSVKSQGILQKLGGMGEVRKKKSVKETC